MKRELTHTLIHPAGWMRPSGYAHGVSATGRIIVTAGQVGWNPTLGGVQTEDFAEQTATALRNIVTILRAGDAGPEHLVRLTWFITSRDEYASAAKRIGAAYRQIIGKHYPAMSVIVVSALLDPRAKVEIEATAVVPA